MSKSRHIRVDNELWEAAKQQADKDELDLVEVIRRLLDAYVDRSIVIEKIIKVKVEGQDSDNG